MTGGPKLFRAILAATAVAWLGYEAYALKTPTKGDTISELVWERSQKPFFVLAVALPLGILLGHFFWQRAPDDGGTP